MFGLFRKKKTELETFCASLSVDKVAQQFEGSESEDGLRRALAVLLLHSAHHFWQSINEGSELKAFAREASADAVIFETTAYVWSRLASDIEEFIEEKSLDEEDPLSQAVTESLHIAISFIDKYANGVHAQGILKARLYPLDRRRAMEKYLGHLLATSGASPGDLSTQVYLTACVGPFTNAYMPGISETGYSGRS